MAVHAMYGRACWVLCVSRGVLKKDRAECLRVALWTELRTVAATAC